LCARPAEAGIKIYHVPHHRWEPGDYVNWKYPSPYQLGAGERQAFAKGTWGGTFHDDFQVQEGDIVVTEHWASSGFRTPISSTSSSATARKRSSAWACSPTHALRRRRASEMELGFHVTLVRDATAARSPEAYHAALNIDGPTYAHEILTTGRTAQGDQGVPVAAAA